jgi:tetratricopeptide (TPR) repeat protein
MASRKAHRRGAREAPVPRADGGGRSPAAWLRLPGSVLAIAFVTVATFAPVLWNGFTNWDDPVNLTDNPFLVPVSWWGIRQLWVAPYENLYVPLFYTSYLGDLALGGGLPRAPIVHAINLLLHVLSAVAVFGIIRRVLADTAEHRRGIPLPALAGALVFAVHPIQTETVAWATGRKDLLSGFFALLAVWSYVGLPAGGAAGAGSKGRFRLHYGSALACFVLALLAKPASVAAPAALLALDFFARRRTLRESARLLAPWFVIAGVWVLATAGSQVVSREARAVLTPLWTRPFIAADALLFYVGKILFPTGLAPVYGRTPLRVYSGAGFWITLPVVLAAGALVFRRRNLFGAAAGVFVAFVLPVLGLIPFVYQRNSTVADRYVYLSMLGVALAVALAVRFAAARVPAGMRAAAAGCGCAIILLLGGLSFRQAQFWRDSETLWERSIEVAPDAALPHGNLGTIYAKAGRAAEAIREYRRSIELDPNQERAHANLGISLLWDEQTTAAFVHLKRAIEIRPEFAAPYATLGDYHVKVRNWEAAIAAYREGIRLDPRNAQAYAGLAFCYHRLKRPAEADRTLREGIVARPMAASLRVVYGDFLADMGERAAAAEVYREALAIEPGNADARSKLAALSASR